MLDFWRGEYERGACRYVDGERSLRAHIEENYFGDPYEEQKRDAFVDAPVLDVGCGAGRDALRYQERGSVLATDVSPNAVRVANERGVDATTVADMFDLPLSDGAVRTVHCFGTQAGLAGSIRGLAALLSEFARVTDTHGRAIVDAHDPSADGAVELFGYRSDPRPGLARRALHFEYDGIVGRTLVFLLLAPERFREAVVPTEWEVADVRRRDGPGYAVCLRK